MAIHLRVITHTRAHTQKMNPTNMELSHKETNCVTAATELTPKQPCGYLKDHSMVNLVYFPLKWLSGPSNLRSTIARITHLNWEGQESRIQLSAIY